MISDDDLANMPDDPELAFVKVEATLRKNLNESIELANENQSNGDQFRIEYVSRVLATAKALDLAFLDGWVVPSRQAEVFDIHANFISEVDHHTMEIRVRHARRTKGYSVAFDAASKTKLRHYLAQIKETVDRLELDPARKEAFYRHIAALDAEINRDRTRYDALAALWLDACEKVGDGFEKLEPVRKWIENIGDIFKKAKSEEDAGERGRLPAPPKKIEPPRRRLPSPDGQQKDDDIPF